MPTLRAETFRGSSADGMPIAGTTIPLTGSTPGAWTPSYPGALPPPTPNYPETPALIVRLEALAGPIYVAFGPTPDATVEPRRLVHPGLVVEARIRSTDKVAAVAAGDIPA
ncbi:hypothetical protein [Methylobacterium sp. GC_Met_2]|uniref:hypothetical protein n=1 Tax=Methylobacterium sp. GC_Met_2 TaxID=2937376 RepID=UPI00226B2001|nr:hypothetical protein [Methylobacterium sp. GC_Met_2]